MVERERKVCVEGIVVGRVLTLYRYPVKSVLGEATVRDLGARVGATLDPIRFRPNILLETAGDRPYEEEDWLGGLLVFGDREDSARIRLDRKDPRCMMVNLDPVRADQNPG